MARRKIPRSPRLARLRQQKILRRTLCGFCLAAVVGLALYALSRPSFFISEVSVSGNSRVPTEAVSALIRRGLSERFLGILPRSHVLLYPKDALRERLLSEFPLLAGVMLSANFNSLSVLLREREPVALWCPEDECFYMDAEGFAFAAAPSGAERNYKRFSPMLAASGTPAVLFTHPIGAPRLREIQGFLRELEQLSLRSSRVRIGESGEVSVELVGGGELRLHDERFDEALTRLSTLLAEPGLIRRGSTGELRVEYIDLRYGNKIYFKPR